MAAGDDFFDVTVEGPTAGRNDGNFLGAAA
jgi:hypothetical protein